MKRFLHTAKFILPSLTEATSPYWRPIKYSLFPPLGLATLAAYLDPSVQVTLVDEHVEPLSLNDMPDLVVLQVYITNAYRSYRIADHYRKKGSYVVLGGLHVTSLPDEAAAHAGSIFLGPGEETFPQFLKDMKYGYPQTRYFSPIRTLERMPPVRRSLIKRSHYLVPNSIVVSRGCPHHCDFCYKDDFFQGGKSFYTQRVDEALAEIERLPGRHLYFLDDHLLADREFARSLFDGMRGMDRLFQGAATVDSVLRGNLIEQAAEAGLRSLFVGFESLNPKNLHRSKNCPNPGQHYEQAIRRLNDLGIMINGSFVFGMDNDDPDVFKRTVDWALNQGITTATFHILTPYPGTDLFKQMESDGRIGTYNWDYYDTRHVVYQTRGLSAGQLKEGYEWAYGEFYRWSNIFRGSLQHDTLKHSAKHFLYTAGWRKFERLWNFAITTRQLRRLRLLLEAVLSRTTATRAEPEKPFRNDRDYRQGSSARNHAGRGFTAPQVFDTNPRRLADRKSL